MENTNLLSCIKECYETAYVRNQVLLISHVVFFLPSVKCDTIKQLFFKSQWAVETVNIGMPFLVRT